MDGSNKATLNPERMTLGPSGGSAVQLGELRPDALFVIAEGIECALSAMELTGWPGGAALSVCGVEKLILPAKVAVALRAEAIRFMKSYRCNRVCFGRGRKEPSEIRVSPYSPLPWLSLRYGSDRLLDGLKISWRYGYTAAGFVSAHLRWSRSLPMT